MSVNLPELSVHLLFEILESGQSGGKDVYSFWEMACLVSSIPPGTLKGDQLRIPDLTSQLSKISHLATAAADSNDRSPTGQVDQHDKPVESMFRGWMEGAWILTSC